MMGRTSSDEVGYWKVATVGATLTQSMNCAWSLQNVSVRACVGVGVGVGCVAVQC